MPGAKRLASPSLRHAESSLPTKKLRKDTSHQNYCKGREDQVFVAADLSQWRLKDMPGGEVYYLPEFINHDLSKDWYAKLDELDTWYHPILKVYGKEVSQSRSIAAYATSETIAVRYSGHQVDLHFKYPDILIEIQRMVEEKLGVKFNHVMLNRYADGREYIGKHRDTKENKVIASLSLGAERTFILSPNKNCLGNTNTKSLVLPTGSLIIMQGDTQKYWKHEIPKEPKVEQGRISLTFRQLQSG